MTEIPDEIGSYAVASEKTLTVGKGPNSVVVDNGGNVWVANTTDSTVSEIAGVAAPTNTPVGGTPAP